MDRKLKKISSNIPADLLEKACSLTDLNQTEALIAGLQELIAQHQRKELVKLRGTMAVKFNPDAARKRIKL